MRVLLTGSSGWLGRFLAPMLREVGHVVVGLDVAAGAETQVLGSVADRRLVDVTFAEYGIEAVVHAGALHKPDLARYPSQSFVDVNVSGTLNLLEAASSAGHDRFVFTSTTSLMISSAIRAERGKAAVWCTEETSPLEPRNMYGVTKLSAECACRVHHLEKGLPVTILRTSRFFPEEDDMAHTSALSGPNAKANELLYRRLTVEDAARAHLVALEKAPSIGFGTFIVSAPTPFVRGDAEALMRDAASVVERYFPEVRELYRRVDWQLPASIGRVYDASLAERVLGFRCKTDFASLLESLRRGEGSPVLHDADYVSPKEPRPDASTT